MLRLSQGVLSLLETCPRKFQYSLLEQLTPPPAEAQQTSLDWGNRFHLLMQQAQLQLPVETILAGQDALRQAFEGLCSANPLLAGFGSPPVDAQAVSLPATGNAPAADNAATAYSSEHLRSFRYGGQSFSVVYDLLITAPDQAQILDWKTYPKPVNLRTLVEHWQTRLYCFALVETSRYEPEQVSMTYWFVRGRDGQAQPESLKIGYSSGQHRQVAADLTQLMAQLGDWMEQFQQGRELPQVDLGEGKCDRCGFLNRCRGLSLGSDRGLAAIDWQGVEEIVP